MLSLDGSQTWLMAATIWNDLQRFLLAAVLDHVLIAASERPKAHE
jgi:hypothetical protein